jgi:integrase
MSSIKDKNGKWLSRFYFTNYKGEKIQKFKRGFKTKREAQEWEREFIAKSKFEITMSFKSLYEMYLEDLSHRLRESTIMNKRHIIENKILPFFGEMELGKITPVIIRKWQNELMKQKNPQTDKVYSQTYIKTINNQLVAILNYAVRYHSLKENPCHKAGSIGKKQADEMEIWTLEEFERFTECLKHKPISFVGFNILFWTGIRVGELLALTVGDIDIENRAIKINKSYQRLNKADVVTDPKTAKGNRIIKITENLTNILAEYIDTLYNVKTRDRLIISTKYRFHHDMKLYSSKAKVKRIRVHDLRHSHASLLIHLGVSPLAIAKRLGHEKIETTLNTYSHLYPDKEKDVIDLLDGLK